MKKNTKIIKVVNMQMIYLITMLLILSSYVLFEFTYIGVVYYKITYEKFDYSFTQMYERVESYGSVLIPIVILISFIHALRCEKIKKESNDELFRELINEIRNSVMYINGLLGYGLIYWVIVSLVKFYNIEGSLLELFSSTTDTWRFCFMFCTFTTIRLIFRLKKFKIKVS